MSNVHIALIDLCNLINGDQIMSIKCCDVTSAIAQIVQLPLSVLFGHYQSMQSPQITCRAGSLAYPRSESRQTLLIYHKWNEQKEQNIWNKTLFSIKSVQSGMSRHIFLTKIVTGQTFLLVHLRTRKMTKKSCTNASYAGNDKKFSGSGCSEVKRQNMVFSEHTRDWELTELRSKQKLYCGGRNIKMYSSPTLCVLCPQKL